MDMQRVNGAVKRVGRVVNQLDYIHEMLQELKQMVPAEAGPMLPYLIDMASVEAIDAIATLADKKTADAFKKA